MGFLNLGKSRTCPASLPPIYLTRHTENYCLRLIMSITTQLWWSWHIQYLAFRAQQQCQFCRSKMLNLSNLTVYVYQIRQVEPPSKSNICNRFQNQNATRHYHSFHSKQDNMSCRATLILMTPKDAHRYQFHNILFNVSAIQVQNIQNITVGDTSTGVLDVQSPDDENRNEGGLNLSEDWSAITSTYSQNERWIISDSLL